MSIKNLYTNLEKNYQTLNVNSIDFANTESLEESVTLDIDYMFDGQSVETIQDGMVIFKFGNTNYINLRRFSFTTPNTSPQQEIVIDVTLPPDFLTDLDQIVGNALVARRTGGNEVRMVAIYYDVSSDHFAIRNVDGSDFLNNIEYDMLNEAFLAMKLR